MNTPSSSHKPFWIIMAVTAILFLAACSICAFGGSLLWQRFQTNVIGDPPGKGPKAEQGYLICAPIIDALAKYNADHGAYPASLDELTPDDLAVINTGDLVHPLQYKLADTEYTLSFRYEGPGVNVCTFTPSKGWDCYGYY